MAALKRERSGGLSDIAVRAHDAGEEDALQHLASVNLVVVAVLCSPTRHGLFTFPADPGVADPTVRTKRALRA